MGKLKNLMIEANDLGIDTTDLSIGEIAKAVDLHYRMERALKPFKYLLAIAGVVILIGVLL